MLVVVGQDVERRQALKPPGFAVTSVAHQGPASVRQVAPRGRAIGVRPDAIQPLDQELQGARAIALVRADESAAAPVLAAVELARDDEAEVLGIVQVGLGGRLEQPPVSLVDLDDRLAEGVDLVAAPELDQALDGTSQVLADLPRVVLGIERSSPVAVVGVLEVPLAEELPELLPAGGWPGLEEADRSADQDQGSHNPKSRENDGLHRRLAPSRSNCLSRSSNRGTPLTITVRPTVS